MHLKRGFTLIELVIVIVVVGIITIAVVSADWTSGPSLNATVNQIASRIRYAQNLANTRDTPYRLTFGSNNLSLTSSDGVTAVNFPSSTSNTLALPSGYTWVVSGLTNSYLIFNRDGYPYIDSAIATQLTANATIAVSLDGNTQTVTISSLTGMVQTPG